MCHSSDEMEQEANFQALDTWEHAKDMLAAFHKGRLFVIEV